MSGALRRNTTTALLVATGLTVAHLAALATAHAAGTPFTPHVLTSDRDGDNEIYTRGVTGGPIKRTNNRFDDFGAAWSPDDTRIAFVSTRDGGEPEIYVMDADGTDRRRLSTSRTGENFADPYPVGEGVHGVGPARRDQPRRHAQAGHQRQAGRVHVMTTTASDLGTIGSVRAEAYTVPTDAPESDGTLEWESTTILVVHVQGAGQHALGYSYTDASAAMLVNRVLADVVVGREVSDVGGNWAAVVDQLRNIGRPGLGSAALSAIDVALWDLKARALGISVAALTPSFRSRVPVYGSGGFTSYSATRLREQLGGPTSSG